MSSPSTVITLGYGSFGNVHLTLGLGYGQLGSLVTDKFLGGIFYRDLSSLLRVFRAIPNRMPINSSLVSKDSSETILYVFDYSNFPEILEGGTLSAPVVVGTGLTVGTPEVTSVERDGVPAGEGIQVLISGGTVNTTVAVECRATIGSSVRVVKGRIAVE